MSIGCYVCRKKSGEVYIIRIREPVWSVNRDSYRVCTSCMTEFSIIDTKCTDLINPGEEIIAMEGQKNVELVIDRIHSGISKYQRMKQRKQIANFTYSTTTSYSNYYYGGVGRRW